MGLTKVDGFNTLYELWLNDGKNKVHVDIGVHAFDDRERDFIVFYDDTMVKTAIKYTDLLLLAQLAEEYRDCEHDWIDLTNPPVITGGEWCRKCNRVRSS